MNVINRSSSDSRFDPLADEEFRIPIFVDVLKTKAICQRNVARLPEMLP